VGKPRDFWLEPNFPNPFNPTTNIRFSVDRQTAVSLVIYDLLGQEVRRLVDEVMSPGTRTLSWDGRDDLGRPQASGTYIYRLKAESFLEAKKMVLLK
jgi:flagellar hook assembly protein FlgD